MAMENCCITGEHDLLVGGDCAWCRHHVKDTDSEHGCSHGRPTCEQAFRAREALAGHH